MEIGNEELLDNYCSTCINSVKNDSISSKISEDMGLMKAEIIKRMSDKNEEQE